MSDSPKKSTKISNAAEAWQCLLELGGAELSTHDELLVCDVANHAGIEGVDSPSDPRWLEISAPQFLQALFAAVAPYGQMLHDVYKLLQRLAASSKDAINGIQVEYDQKAEGLDLYFFKRAVEEWERFERTNVGAGESFHVQQLWAEIAPSAVLRDTLVTRKQLFDPPSASDCANWIRLNSPRGRESSAFDWSLPPHPGPIEDPELRSIVDRLHALVCVIIRSCSRFGTFDALRRNGVTKSEGIAGLKELPDKILLWARASLWWLESDGFSAGMMSYCLAIVSRQTKEWDAATLDQLRQWARALADKLPLENGDCETQLRRTINHIFELPLWNRRSLLYQLWVLTEIANAFPELKAVAGPVIALSPNTCVLHFIDVNFIRLIVAERYVPLADPVGKSRKSGCQPDFAIDVLESAARRTVAVVEAKQYWKASSTNFGDACFDYARAFPNVPVALASSGKAPESVLHVVEDHARDKGLDAANLREQITLFGELRPDHQNTREKFKALLRESSPPIPLSNVKVVMVDTSASMAHFLSTATFKEMIFEFLTRRAPNAIWYRCDKNATRLGRSQKARESLESPLVINATFERSYIEAIAEPLDFGSPVAEQDVLVITDSSGREELSRVHARPGFVLVSDGFPIGIFCQTTRTLTPLERY